MAEHHISENIKGKEKEQNIETDSSLNRSQGPQTPVIESNLPSKKRIGPYSYKLADVIGSGFSSIVFKGYKDNDKKQVVAIKVIKLNNMKSHRRRLLENEIKILKTINHPNVLTFRDLFYTINHCYIITQFCEGGSLQTIFDSNDHFDWRQPAYEVCLACKYLASQNIMHRDIKPSNVLLTNGVFKLCDFGFSSSFNSDEPIKQNYLIGSPLYMPPQSLSEHLYSTKGDSFALGVLLYYITSGKFPWKGKTQAELQQNYKVKKPSKSGIAHLPPRVKYLINNLIQLNPSKRLHLSDCDCQVFQHLGPNKLQENLQNLKGCYTQQLKLCQFINSLLQHSDIYAPFNSFLKGFVSHHLSSLTLKFEWERHPALNSVRLMYNTPLSPKFSSDDYYWINNCLKDTIRDLSYSSQQLLLVMLQKLLLYQQVVEGILFESKQELFKRINNMVLHTDFSALPPNQQYIRQTISRIDFYQL